MNIVLARDIHIRASVHTIIYLRNFIQDLPFLAMFRPNEGRSILRCTYRHIAVAKVTIQIWGTPRLISTGAIVSTSPAQESLSQ